MHDYTTLQTILLFRKDLFLEDVNNANINPIPCDDVNKSMNRLTSILQIRNSITIAIRNTPIRKASHNKRRLMKNPWISKAILKYIKKIHKLCKSHF